MSIQNSTLHYHFPLVTGSDRPVFGDYNTAMELLDEQLYSAVSSVTVFAEQIAALQETSGDHTTELAELDTFKTEQVGINTANAERFLAITQALSEQVVTNNNKFNSVSIADAYDAAKTYSVGDVVTYNGDRYRCITAITTGEPFDADKWQGEDVQSVLDSLKLDNDISVAGDGIKTYAQLFNELFNLIDISRVKKGTLLRIGSIVYQLCETNSDSYYEYHTVTRSNSAVSIRVALVTNNVSTSTYEMVHIDHSGTTSYSDSTSSVVTSGLVIGIVY